MRTFIVLIAVLVLTACGAPQPAPQTQSTIEPTAPRNGVAALPMLLRGVNLSGADFGSCCPGREGYDYGWPNAAEVDYFRAKGMDTFRVGFRWERLQPVLKGELDVVYGGKLDALVVYATSKGAAVVLNPQNFARYNGAIIGSAAVPNAAFADLWRRLALKYKGNARVVFGLVNEPHTMPSEQWVSAANAAISAIRAAGATNTVAIPGNAWTGAHSWASSWYGTANAIAMLKVVDSGPHVFEVHNYLDADGSGKGTECVSGTIGSERMRGVVAWARGNGKRVYVGEFGAPNTVTCSAAVKDFLAYAAANADVIAGWTWWSAGPRWDPEYQLDIEPKAGVDRPQMAWLLPFLTPPVVPVPTPTPVPSPAAPVLKCIVDDAGARATVTIEVAP